MTAAETLQDPAVQETLAQLRDIHLPEAVSAWPPAPLMKPAARQ